MTAVACIVAMALVVADAPQGALAALAIAVALEFARVR